MKSYKIIVWLLISLFVFGSTFAYDLTDKEKSKWDKIVNKVLLLISKKAEDKEAV